MLTNKSKVSKFVSLSFIPVHEQYHTLYYTRLHFHRPIYIKKHHLLLRTRLAVTFIHINIVVVKFSDVARPRLKNPYYGPE